MVNFVNCRFFIVLYVVCFGVWYGICNDVVCVEVVCIFFVIFVGEIVDVEGVGYLLVNEDV